MPIDYKEYHPKWSLISRLIRFVRAKGYCEECAVANYSVIDKKDRGLPAPAQLDIYNEVTRRFGYTQQKALKAAGLTKIVLTVAHLDHDKTNNRFWNLKALCQRCHLRHDIKQHAANRKYGRDHKTNNLKLEL